MKKEVALFVLTMFIVLSGNVSGYAKTPNLLTTPGNESAMYNATGRGGNEKTGEIIHSLNVTKSGNDCVMIDPDRNIAAGKDVGIPYRFNCPVSSGESYNGGYSPVNDVFYYLGVTSDMYKAFLGVDVYTKQLFVTAIYKDGDSSQWDPVQGITLYGGTDRLYPMTSVDIVAHEAGHAFTSENSSLSLSSESGVINEAYSDISGVAARYYLNGAVDFLWGDAVTKPGALQDNKQPMEAIRYLCEPTKDGYSIDNYIHYDKGVTDPHYASGIYNKAYCLLAKTPGWDIKSAFQVFAKANMKYWGPFTDMKDGACGILHAAKELNKKSTDVVNAFAAVGITVCSDGPLPDKFSQISVIQTGNTGQIARLSWPADVKFPQTGFANAQFLLQLNNTPTSYDVVWRSSDDAVASVKQNGLVTLKIPGSATITATVNGVDINYHISPKKWFIIANTPDPLNLSQQDAFCQSQGGALPAIESLTSASGPSDYKRKIGALVDEWGNSKQYLNQRLPSSTLTGNGSFFSAWAINGYKLTQPVTSSSSNFTCLINN
ncbi:M4 family metallopeptidase [Enterobacter kobei]|uniref:M4 family metallopeptidase n=1 Tax=Enterobacter kobei TaxID=208224 RepID=UPI003CF2C74A